MQFLPLKLLSGRGLLVASLVTLGARCLPAQRSDDGRTLPTAPSTLLATAPADAVSSSLDPAKQVEAQATTDDPKEQGKSIRQQKGRIFGIVPNFATVSGGAKPAPAGWRTDFRTANRQALDYSSFGYLFLSSATAYGLDQHPSLNTYHGGDAIFWAYLWRGFLDKTDGVYQGTFLFPALLHEDTRYYAMGQGSIKRRTLHALDSIVIARSYSGRSIPNVAGIAGRVGTQAVSTVYYPPGSEGFGTLAEKFSYSIMRQAGINVLREFSPDLDALVHHRRHKADAQ